MGGRFIIGINLFLMALVLGIIGLIIFLVSFEIFISSTYSNRRSRNFKDFLLEDGHSLTTIQLDEGDAIPSNLMNLMPCFAWAVQWIPIWNKNILGSFLKKAIGEYVLNLEKPFLGFCLGCQLLGEVLGGQVVKSSPSEIGV